MLLCCATPSCFIMMCYAFMLRHAFTLCHAVRLRHDVPCLCCATPSCFIMMCYAFMLRHTITCGSGCQPVTALAGQCITHCGNIFHVPTLCLPSNVAQSNHGQHNTAAHGSVDAYSCEVFISYEHTAEHWNLMQDCLLCFGGAETHLSFGEFSR